MSQDESCGSFVGKSKPKKVVSGIGGDEVEKGWGNKGVINVSSDGSGSSCNLRFSDVRMSEIGSDSWGVHGHLHVPTDSDLGSDESDPNWRWQKNWNDTPVIDISSDSEVCSRFKCPKKESLKVSDEGQNWSTGQRQLFFLGRVLLKRNRILLLDEEFTPIDSTTDAILQKIIREEFTECTVITVAHRVPTVRDSDMVMLLSFEELIEYDEPAVLMHTNSAFADLVEEYWSSYRNSTTTN